MYREQPPPPALAGVVECLWRHDGRGDSPVLPDGRVDLVWTVVDRVYVAGPQTGPMACPFDPPFAAAGVRFHPGVAPALLGVPAHELVDAHVPLADIDTGPARTLHTRLDRLPDPREGVETVATWARAGRGPDPLVGHAAALLGGRVPVAEVAREVALSERQLQRRFQDSVGYGPKTLQRILRFRRFLAVLSGDARTADGALARAAAEAGYADQPHLTRESRRLAGRTPRELARLWRG